MSTPSIIKQPPTILLNTAERVALGTIEDNLRAVVKQRDEIVRNVLERNHLPENTRLQPIPNQPGAYVADIPRTENQTTEVVADEVAKA